MLKELLYPLVQYFSGFNLFQYISFRGAYAMITALSCTVFLGPVVIRIATNWRLGQQIRAEGPDSHLAKAETPTMGGVMIIACTLFSVFLWQDLHNLYVWIAILTIFSFGALGFMDDYLKITHSSSTGMRARVKIIGQIIISLVIVLLLYYNRDSHSLMLYMPFLKAPLFNMGWLFIPFGVFLLVATTNAVNLTDGLDGLATGLVVIVLMAFSLLTYLTGHKVFAEYLLIPYIEGSGEIFIVIQAILGACVGFLWFNCYPAQIMMGDTGSLSLGGAIGVFALMIKKEILLAIIAGVFLAETVSVILQVFYVKKLGKRLFKMTPIHHHFELSGWAESKVVTRFWIVGGLLAVIGLSTLKTR